MLHGNLAGFSSQCRRPKFASGRIFLRRTNRTSTMRNIDQIYINGAFVTPHGRERAELINPATEAVIGHVTLGDREDTLLAIAAAKRAWPAYARSTKAERIALLHSLHDAVLARADDINAATTEEYGGPVSRASWVASYAAGSFLLA